MKQIKLQNITCIWPNICNILVFKDKLVYLIQWFVNKFSILPTKCIWVKIFYQESVL